jgi:hypothetical protein
MPVSYRPASRWLAVRACTPATPWVVMDSLKRHSSPSGRGLHDEHQSHRRSPPRSAQRCRDLRSWPMWPASVQRRLHVRGCALAHLRALRRLRVEGERRSTLIVNGDQRRSAARASFGAPSPCPTPPETLFLWERPWDVSRCEEPSPARKDQRGSGSGRPAVICVPLRHGVLAPPGDEPRRASTTRSHLPPRAGSDLENAPARAKSER